MKRHGSRTEAQQRPRPPGTGGDQPAAAVKVARTQKRCMASLTTRTIKWGQETVTNPPCLCDMAWWYIFIRPERKEGRRGFSYRTSPMLPTSDLEICSGSLILCSRAVVIHPLDSIDHTRIRGLEQCHPQVLSPTRPWRPWAPFALTMHPCTQLQTWPSRTICTNRVVYAAATTTDRGWHLQSGCHFAPPGDRARRSRSDNEPYRRAQS